jgi:hypothetical protein
LKHSAVSGDLRSVSAWGSILEGLLPNLAKQLFGT